MAFQKRIKYYHNKKIRGGGQFDPPPSKPDVRLNRVKTLDFTNN